MFSISDEMVMGTSCGHCCLVPMDESDCVSLAIANLSRHVAETVLVFVRGALAQREHHHLVLAKVESGSVRAVRL